MKTEEIIAAITTKVKSDLQNHAEDLNKPLTAENVENAENVAKLIGNAVLSAAGEGFKTSFLQNEPQENTIIVDCIAVSRFACETRPADERCLAILAPQADAANFRRLRKSCVDTIALWESHVNWIGRVRAFWHLTLPAMCFLTLPSPRGQ